MIAHIPWLAKKSLSLEKSRYGKMTTIEDFMVPLPAKVASFRSSNENASLDKANLLTFGDSFFDFNRQLTLPYRLKAKLDIAVNYSRRRYPLKVLEKENYKYGKEKILIYELVERNIPEIFSFPHLVKQNKESHYIEKIMEKLFPQNLEKSYSFLLESSRLTYNLYSWYATIRYRWLEYMPNTSKYLENPPWIFYHKTVENVPGGFYYNYSEAEIEQYCNNILRLKNDLKEQYNLRMLFMPIPNKYTIYHRLLNNDKYNNFLPNLYTNLEKKGVEVIKLYEPFKESRDTLYYGTDTHWNEAGVSLATEIVIDYLWTCNQAVEKTNSS